MNELIQAWYNLLSGHLTYNGLNVGVFKEDIPEDYPAANVGSTDSPHYVWIRGEGGTDDSNKARFADDDIVIIDIITTFTNNVNRQVVETIDNAVRALVYASASVHNFSQPANMQFGQTIRENFDYVYEPAEQVGGEVIYRKVSRYKTRTIYA